MELRQLRYFVKVAELNSFSEASRQLNITQSTLSQQIKQLEGELDVERFPFAMPAKGLQAGTQMEGSFHVLQDAYMKRSTKEFLRMLCENRSYGMALMEIF